MRVPLWNFLCQTFFPFWRVIIMQGWLRSIDHGMVNYQGMKKICRFLDSMILKWKPCGLVGNQRNIKRSVESLICSGPSNIRLDRSESMWGRKLWSYHFVIWNIFKCVPLADHTGPDPQWFSAHCRLHPIKIELHCHPSFERSWHFSSTDRNCLILHALNS